MSMRHTQHTSAVFRQFPVLSCQVGRESRTLSKERDKDGPPGRRNDGGDPHVRH